MADIFGTIVQNMQSMGFFQYVFPFLLSLAILYGLLEWGLGDRIKNKSALALISLIFSFFVMLYVSANPGIVSFLTNISGYWLVVGSGILFLILFLGLVGIKVQEDFLGSKWGKYTLALVVIAIAVALFFGAGGTGLVSMPSWAFSSELWTIIFFVVVMAIVLLMMGGEQATGGGTKKPAAG